MEHAYGHTHARTHTSTIAYSFTEPQLYSHFPVFQNNVNDKCWTKAKTIDNDIFLMALVFRSDELNVLHTTMIT